jgi:hypothetical protein
MAQKMQSNFPTESFANFIYQGFTSGVDTEVIKLFESSKRGNKIIVGAKTITAIKNLKTYCLNKLIEYLIVDPQLKSMQME